MIDYYEDDSEARLREVIENHLEEAKPLASSLIQEAREDENGCRVTDTAKPRKVRFRGYQWEAYRFIYCVLNEVIAPRHPTPLSQPVVHQAGAPRGGLAGGQQARRLGELVLRGGPGLALRQPREQVSAACTEDHTRSTPRGGSNRGTSGPSAFRAVHRFKSRKSYGWGGRIRTYGTRYQKPLPYHLATPQR